MPDRPAAFFLLSVLALTAVVAVFAMKYVVAARASGGRAALQGALAELAGVKLRLAALEKMLREVG